MFISYAQNYEDVMLWRALKHIEHGLYIDVGANDPVLDSVTEAFYQRGWSGINIEPVRFYYERLCEARPRDVNLQVVADEKEDEIVFYEVPETGLSSINKDIALKQESFGRKIIERKIRTSTLNLIFEKHVHGPIHFLKIDVEGSEENVISGLDLSMWRPWILIIESTLPCSTEENYFSWEPMVLGANYEMVYFDGLNRYYLAEEHAELKEFFYAPPNIHDQFITNNHKLVIDQYVESAGTCKAYSQRLNEYEKESEELAKKLRESEEESKALSNKLQETENQVTGLIQQLVEKENEIENLTKQLFIKEQETVSLTQQLIEKASELGVRLLELETIHNSRSYGVALKLRRLYHFGKLLKSSPGKAIKIMARKFFAVLKKGIKKIPLFVKLIRYAKQKLPWFEKILNGSDPLQQNPVNVDQAHVYNFTGRDEERFFKLIMHEVEKEMGTGKE